MSYILQETPDPSCVYRATGEEVTPVATLRDPYGGVSQIIVDDHCYVLLNGTYEKGFAPSPYWYSEAVAAMKTLPLPR
jgi:hypothetical protein